MKRYLSPLLLAAMVGCSAPAPALAGNLGACLRAPDNNGGVVEHRGITFGLSVSFANFGLHLQTSCRSVSAVLAVPLE